MAFTTKFKLPENVPYQIINCSSAMFKLSCEISYVNSYIIVQEKKSSLDENNFFKQSRVIHLATPLRILLEYLTHLLKCVNAWDSPEDTFVSNCLLCR